MPLFYQDDLDENTRLAVWKIDEPEYFFLSTVSVQREITHPQKRLQHLAARYLLSMLYPDFPHHQITIAAQENLFYLMRSIISLYRIAQIMQQLL